MMEEPLVLERTLIAALREVTVNLRARIAKLEQLEANPQTITILEALDDTLLTTLDQDINGCSISLGPGFYLVEGTFDIRSGVDANDNSQTAVCTLNVDGATNSRTGEVNLLNDGTTRLRGIISLSWKISLTSSVVVKLQVRKTGGTGSAVSLGGNTIMKARTVAMQ